MIQDQDRNNDTNKIIVFSYTHVEKKISISTLQANRNKKWRKIYN